MNKREKILDFIKGEVGSGRPIIIFTPKGVDSESFLTNEVKPFLEENFNNCLISFSSAFSSEIDYRLFNSIASSDRKTFILIDDLSLYKNPLSIIQMLYGNNNVDVIATSSVLPSFLAGKDETDIRGRYSLCFYPPFLYGDELNNNQNYNIKDFFDHYFYDYRYKKVAQKIYLYILKNIGQILSIRDIYLKCGEGVSLVTFVNIINYLKDSGLFYVLNRIKLDSLQTMNYGFAFYPCRAQDIMAKELDVDDLYREKAFYDSLILARAFYDGDEIYKAVYFKKVTVGNKRINVNLNDCFLIKNGNKQLLMKTKFNKDNSSDSDMFLKCRCNIQKVIIYNNHRNSIVDSNGIIRCSVYDIVNKGIFFCIGN